MENTSEGFINFTSPLLFGGSEDCSKCNSFEIIFCYSVMILCFFLGTPAHVWCIWSYLHCDWKSKQSALFLLNHNIMELLICIECAIEALNALSTNDDRFFHVAIFIFGLCWIGRPLIQACICIEQYFAVLHPIMFLRYKDIKYRIPAVVATWMVAFAYSLYDIMGAAFPDPLMNVVLLISLAVISFCWASVLHALKHPGPGDMCMTRQRGRDVVNQQKKNAYNMVISALLIVFLTYIPYIINSVCYVVQMDRKMLSCHILPFLSSFTIYGVMISPIMKMYKERHHLKCLCRANKGLSQGDIIR